MSWRSRLWWAAALVTSAAGAGYVLSRSARGFGMFSAFAFCPGREVSFEARYLLWSVAEWVPLLWYGGAPAVALAFLAHWSSSRRGRPRIGRVTSRGLAASVLVLYGMGPLAFAVDMAVDRECFEVWGGIGGVMFFLDTDIAPTLAALCVLAAVRIPKYRVRRVLRTRWFRRGAVSVAALGLLSFLPISDLGSGPITPRSRCEGDHGDGTKVLTGERAFLCSARDGGRFDGVADYAVLAYGRARCEAYPHPGVDAWTIAPICPAAAADVQRELDAEEAGYQAEETENQKVCDSSRHRPLIKPLRVARERTWTDYGVLESFEAAADDDSDPFEDDLLNLAQDNDLVASLPGHLMILSHSDYDICVIAETYRSRPPVEVKDWDHVVEVGYESPAGRIELMDPMAGEGDLPNLAFHGKGHYRVRVHYREPEWEEFTPQHILIMVYPGRSDRVVEYRRRS
ncbi:hypothetical protein AB0M44_17520 [Streptosporangium subroseum]|uniref:hypothetical protein n=1 Tax=Streptosporangium subroseum TaxID=106412 RepID=UPI003438E8F7